MGIGPRSSRRRTHDALRLAHADLAAERELTAALTAVLTEQPELTDSGLDATSDVIASARAQTELAAAAADLRPTFTPTADIGTLAAPVAAQLLASLRESLANVVRHAHARTLTVDLELAETGVTLCVTDDGVGIDAGAGPLTGGLRRLHDRSARLGGWCLCHRPPAGGTSLVWHVPGAGPRSFDDDVPAGLTDRLADAVGPLASRLAIAHGTDRLAVFGEALRLLTDADCYLALVAAPDGHSMQVVRTDGFAVDVDPIGAIVPRHGSLPWHALYTGRALRIGALSSLPDAARHLGRLPLGPGMVVPLRPGQGPATALGLARTAGRTGFRPAEVDVAVTLAAVGSAMLDLQPVQAVIDAWPSAEFDYTDAVSVAGFPFVSAVPRKVRR